jgi:putative ABC transport system permease protein
METFLQDLRYALRNLVRQPGFAATAILTLALGIGATTAIFSVVNAVVLRPLPYREPDAIVAVRTLWTKTGLNSATVSAPDFHDWKAQNRSFDALAYYSGGEAPVMADGNPDYATTYIVTPGFFDALGVGPRAGRLFTPEEEKAGGPLAAVITDAYWRRQFGARADAIGSTLKLGDQFFTIVGVLPPGLRFPARADVYAPAAFTTETASRSGHNYQVIGRLKAGVSLEQAQGEMSAIASRLADQYPISNAGKSVLVMPLKDLLVRDTRATLYVLLAAVSFVLLIACANVANLLLARSTARSREMVVRAAVGAGRGRLVRQLLTEGLVLALVSAAIGAALARGGVIALLALAPTDLPRLDEIQVDTTALGFALLISLLASVIFGLAPALHVSRVRLAEGLRQGGKGSALGARSGLARNAFVVAEIALAVVLVVAAGLLGRSLVALAQVDMGFSPERVLVLRTSFPVNRDEDAPRAVAFYRDALRDVRAVPGVDAASGVLSIPTSVRSNGSYWLEGGPGPDQTGVNAPEAVLNVVTPDYFRTMRIPVKRGRDFTENDRADAPFVAIVSEALVRESFGGRDPIGHRIQCGLDSLAFMTIVGVVGDVRTYGPARPPQPEIYMPFEQHPLPSTVLTIMARTAAPDPLALTETIRRVIHARNPEVPMKASTMERTLLDASAAPRFRTFLLVVFAAVALLLAVAGVYGVMAYTVSQRVPEIGVRVALGASPADIMRMIVGQGARLAAVGLGVGLVLALAASRLLQGLLFGVTARDPLILAAVTALVTSAALAACYIPGRRALRVEPTVALRAE